MERKYALRAVRQRLHQSSFREAVIMAYNGRCALSGLPEPLLLDAAHIVPDGNERLGQPVVEAPSRGLRCPSDRHRSGLSAACIRAAARASRWPDAQSLTRLNGAPSICRTASRTTPIESDSRSASSGSRRQRDSADRSVGGRLSPARRVGHRCSWLAGRGLQSCQHSWPRRPVTVVMRHRPVCSIEVGRPVVHQAAPAISVHGTAPMRHKRELALHGGGC